jgi:hypothetical protein
MTDERVEELIAKQQVCIKDLRLSLEIIKAELKAIAAELEAMDDEEASDVLAD